MNAFNELSEPVKKIVRKAWQQTLLSPLSAVRVWQETATGQKYIYLVEAENFLINE